MSSTNYFENEYNESIHLMNIFKLEQKVFKVRNNVTKLRKQIISYDSKKDHNDKYLEIIDLCELKEVSYYNRLEDLCLYIMYFTKNKIRSDLLIEIKKKYNNIFGKIWSEEKIVFKEEYFDEKYPFIVELLKEWDIWK